MTAIDRWLTPGLPLSVANMAAAIGLSPARFSHLFVRTTGMLPREFLHVLKQYHSEREQASAVLQKAGTADMTFLQNLPGWDGGRFDSPEDGVL